MIDLEILHLGFCGYMLRGINDWGRLLLGILFFIGNKKNFGPIARSMHLVVP